MKGSAETLVLEQSSIKQKCGISGKNERKEEVDLLPGGRLLWCVHSFQLNGDLM